ncbi:MAG: TetR/AcrR family transcriptional regulator, partial [Aquabacterium sp.]
MPAPKLKPTRPPPPPERGVKAATFHLLLSTAVALIREQGRMPSVAAVATRAKVSRATAYRYFGSRSALGTAVIDASLESVRGFSSSDPDARGRVRELFRRSLPLFRESEAELRAALQMSLEHWGLERAGLLEEEPYRRGHRVRLLDHALAPMDAELPPATRLRLHRALSVLFGIESFVVLTDIWQLSDRELERVCMWMVEALLEAALREAG